MTQQVDERSGARLFGGDMIEWSDFAGGRRPGDAIVEELPRLTPTEEYFFGRLLADAAPQRVLLAGPSAARLLPLVDPHAAVDVLVRARTDARVLRGIHQRSLVWCGALARFHPEKTWDLVISLDPVGRLCTPDDGDLAPADAFARLRGLVADSGSLYMRLDNRLGLDRLLFATNDLEADENWTGGAWPGSERVVFSDVRALLDGAGAESDCFALVPGASRTTLIANAAILRNPAQASVLAALIGRVSSDEQARLGGVQDFWSVVDGVVHAAQALSMAPAWLVRVGRPAALPQLVAEVDPPSSSRAQLGFRRLGVIEDEGGPLAWTPPPGGKVTGSYMERQLCRQVTETDRLDGCVVEVAWRQACGTGHVEPVRRVVRRWADWMRSAQGPDEAHRFFATPDNTLVAADGTFVLMDGSWSWLSRVPVEVAICHGLRTFAWRLIKAGTPHPWNADVSTDGLASTLAAMGGVEWTDRLLRQTAEIEEGVSAILEGRSVDDADEWIVRNLDAGRASALVTGGWVMGRRESADTMGRLARELGARSEQVEWLESQVTWQDARMNVLKRELTDIRKSGAYKLARQMTAPGRAVIKSGRAVVKRAVPAKYWRRLDKVSRRMAAE